MKNLVKNLFEQKHNTQMNFLEPNCVITIVSDATMNYCEVSKVIPRATLDLNTENSTLDAIIDIDNIVNDGATNVVRRLTIVANKFLKEVNAFRRSRGLSDASIQIETFDEFSSDVKYVTIEKRNKPLLNKMKKFQFLVADDEYDSVLLNLKSLNTYFPIIQDMMIKARDLFNKKNYTNMKWIHNPITIYNIPAWVSRALVEDDKADKVSVNVNEAEAEALVEKKIEISEFDSICQGKCGELKNCFVLTTDNEIRYLRGAVNILHPNTTKGNGMTMHSVHPLFIHFFVALDMNDMFKTPCFSEGSVNKLFHLVNDVQSFTALAKDWDVIHPQIINSFLNKNIQAIEGGVVEKLKNFLDLTIKLIYYLSSMMFNEKNFPNAGEFATIAGNTDLLKVLLNEFENQPVSENVLPKSRQNQLKFCTLYFAYIIYQSVWIFYIKDEQLNTDTNSREYKIIKAVTNYQAHRANSENRVRLKLTEKNIDGKYGKQRISLGVTGVKTTEVPSSNINIKFSYDEKDQDLRIKKVNEQIEKKTIRPDK